MYLGCVLLRVGVSQGWGQVGGTCLEYKSASCDSFNYYCAWYAGPGDCYKDNNLQRTCCVLSHTSKRVCIWQPVLSRCFQDGRRRAQEWLHTACWGDKKHVHGKETIAILWLAWLCGEPIDVRVGGLLLGVGVSQGWGQDGGIGYKSLQVAFITCTAAHTGCCLQDKIFPSWVYQHLLCAATAIRTDHFALHHFYPWTHQHVCLFVGSAGG